MQDPKPPPDFTPQRPPETPWYERKSARLGPDEIDDYDRQMAPQRLQQRRRLFQ